MESLEELLSRLSSNSLGISKMDAVKQAPDIVNMIIKAQKTQRSAPYADQLKANSDAWATANSAQRQALNQKNNAIRSAYVSSGGSPIDMDQKLWGGSPLQGFQTGVKKYMPSYAGDNMSIGQKIAQAPISGLYEGRPTLDKTTADRNYQVQQGQLKNDAFNNETGRINAGTNAYSAQTDAAYKQGSLALDATKLAQSGSSATSDAVTKAITYANGSIDKLTVGQPTVKRDTNGMALEDDNGKPLTELKQVDLNPTNKASLKEHFRIQLQSLVDSGDPAGVLSQAKDDIYAKYGKYEGNVLYNLLQGAVGSMGE